MSHLWATLYWRFRNWNARLEPEPIFIGGNQKAGTTAIAGLLAEAIGVSWTNDVFYRLPTSEKQLLNDQIEFSEVQKRLACWLESKVIKDPSLFFLRAGVAKAYPNSKWVFILRDPRQNIRSILNRLNIPGDMADLTVHSWDVIRKSPGWQPLFDGDGLGGRQTSYIRTLATRWCRSVESFLHYREASHFVKYEAFCEDKVGVIERLAAELGFNVVRPIGSVINNAYQPIGDRSIIMEEFFGKANLALIQEICGPYMEQFGYTT